MSRSYCHCDKLTPGYIGSAAVKRSWLERLLLWLLPHFDIIKDIEGPNHSKHTVLYLRRYYLWRSKWIGMNFGDLYLHQIVRSDDDPDPHDHPWNFRSFILSGGYTDEAWMFTDLDGHGNGYRTRLPGSDDPVRAPATRFRHRRHIHRVILRNGEPAWTLVWTTGYTHDADGNAEWAFITEERRVPWREYLGLTKGEDHGG